MSYWIKNYRQVESKLQYVEKHFTRLSFECWQSRRLESELYLCRQQLSALDRARQDYEILKRIYYETKDLYCLLRQKLRREYYALIRNHALAQETVKGIEGKVAKLIENLPVAHSEHLDQLASRFDAYQNSRSQVQIISKEFESAYQRLCAMIDESRALGKLLTENLKMEPFHEDDIQQAC